MILRGCFLTVICLWPLAGLAQWIQFSEDTSARLVLTSVAINDGEEKDIANGDFDKDGWEDVVVVRKAPFSTPGARADLLLMNENGVLTDRTTQFAPQFISIPSDSRDVVAIDLTGDDWLDLVFANTFEQQPTFYRNLGEDGGGNWLGFLEESAARFPTITPLNQPGGPQFCAVWAGDLDGDTDPDLYFSNYAPSGGTTDALLINDGSGFFSDQTAARLGANANVAFGTSAEFHDVDGDKDLDIVKTSTLYEVAPFDPLGVYILYNDGSGQFNNLPITRIPSPRPYMFTAGFLDQNDRFDFYVVDDFSDVVAFVETTVPDGPVTFSDFTVAPSPRTAGFGGNVKFADMDQDGDLDVAVGPIDVDIANCDDGARFALLRNPGDGRVTDPWTDGDDQPFHTEPHDFALIDIDRDGCIDIFMGMCTGWIVFMRANCGGLACFGDCAPDQGNGNYGDGVVDALDFAAAIADWGNPGGPCDVAPDLGEGNYGDGRVRVDDLLAILAAFGPCKP